LPVLQAIKPLSFKAVTIFPLMYTISGCFRLVPLTDIAVTEDSLPDTLALLESCCPLALVHLTVSPCVDTLSVWLSIQEVTLVSVSVRVALHSTTTAGVILPLTFIDARFAILHDTESMTLTVN